MPRTALITGAARGIGLATARAFLDEGWQVALLDIDGPAQAAAAAGLGAGAMALMADVAVEEQVNAAVAAAAKRFGAIDAVVNNAGIAVFKPLLETTPAEWARVLDVNLTGPFLVTRAAMAHMPRGGAVVNIASISGQRASTLRVAYGTSKAGIMHLTKQMAAEFAHIGVRANCVAPGPVDTAMAKAVHSPEIRADYHDAIPLNRYGLEEEIANAIWFLCSDQSTYVNGQTLAVDGGFESTGIGLPTLRKG
jgi:NAD(P)-dependent dehydrogenase (short-subunit alcohol dehydrogenase family)